MVLESAFVEDLTVDNATWQEPVEEGVVMWREEARGRAHSLLRPQAISSGEKQPGVQRKRRVAAYAHTCPLKTPPIQYH